MTDAGDIFLVAPPGLEQFLFEEVQQLGFKNPVQETGGVSISGDLGTVAKANHMLRGATRVLLRIASFRVMHLAQLDKRARKVEWAEWLRPDVDVSVETVCRKSKIYHSKAATQRIAQAITKTTGTPVKSGASLVVKARIEDDLCTISLDTSGAALHLRGLKGNVGKAPIRENLAALCLRASGYSGDETVVDPMCGSGTFVIEAAEMALGLTPGRTREFAYQHLAKGTAPPRMPQARDTDQKFFGFDRDAGAISGAKKNAEITGVTDNATFAQQALSDLQPPDTAPGLVMINPPYGTRVGDRKTLFALYGTFGNVMRDRFTGWRVGMVTSDPGLAKACGLNWDKPILFDNGGITVGLYRTKV